MTLRLHDWLIAADEWPWRTRLLLAAIYGPDMAEGRIPERILARKTLLSAPRTIRPALDWMEAAAWIKRHRGYSTATQNPTGKRLATGAVLWINPLLLTGSFTIIGAADYERFDTAEKRWKALVRASRRRAKKGFVTLGVGGRDAEVGDVLALTDARFPEPLSFYSVSTGSTEPLSTTESDRQRFSGLRHVETGDEEQAQERPRAEALLARTGRPEPTRKVKSSSDRASAAPGIAVQLEPPPPTRDRD